MFGGLFGGPGGGFGGPPGGFPQRFDQRYQVYPVSFKGREDMEEGNKLLLPASALQTLAQLNISYPMLFEVTNPALDRRTHSGVLEFSAEEGMVFMPYWMMNNLCLHEGSMVRITSTTLPKGRYVKLQPVTSDFLDIHNPKAVLEKTLRNFATLSCGDNICIRYNNRTYEIEVVETKPQAAIQIIETDVEVDFAPPKDYVEPTAASSAADAAMPEVVEEEEEEEEEEGPDLFSGAGVRLDGKAIKQVLPTSSQMKKQKQQDPWGEEPWRHRLPGGVITKPPLAYVRIMAEKGRTVKQESDFTGAGHSLK
mmetsp:Transcript_556/g.1218  ORF Transcript_556/g.1218 Transcript_556/m.1218 type:complete len:309 (+) Transcript_556:43-969(+)